MGHTAILGFWRKVTVALETYPFAADGMCKAQLGGMQQQARRQCGNFRRRIQRIAQDRVAYGQQMHAQLVAAPGEWLQFQG